MKKTSSKRPGSKTRLQQEMDVETLAAESSRRREVLKRWEALPAEEQARVRTEGGYASDGPDPVRGALLADYGEMASAAAHAGGVPADRLLSWLIAHYQVTGNPLFALQAIAQWPPAAPLHALLRGYLQRSLQPLLSAAAAISLGEEGALSPTDAAKEVPEWFGLAGRPGAENAFSQHKSIIEAEEAADAFERHLKIEGKKTLAAKAAAAELGISLSTLADRRNLALRLNKGFAGLSSGSEPSQHVNNGKSQVPPNSSE